MSNDTFEHIVYMIEALHYLLEHFHTFFPIFCFHNVEIICFECKDVPSFIHKKGRFR